jgi:hypothetical protein
MGDGKTYRRQRDAHVMRCYELDAHLFGGGEDGEDVFLGQEPVVECEAELHLKSTTQDIVWERRMMHETRNHNSSLILDLAL